MFKEGPVVIRALDVEDACCDPIRVSEAFSLGDHFKRWDDQGVFFIFEGRERCVISVDVLLHCFPKLCFHSFTMD